MSDTVLSQFTQEVEEEKKVSDKKFRVGIIGTGGISHCHMAGYKALDTESGEGFLDRLRSDAREEVRKVNVEYVVPVQMRLGVGLHRPPRHESHRIRVGNIHRYQQSGKACEDVPQFSGRGRYEADATALLRDGEFPV